MVCTSSHHAQQASERSAPRASGISTSASRAPMVPSACLMSATPAPSALRESTRTRRGRRPAAPARRIPTTLTLTPRHLQAAGRALRVLILVVETNRKALTLARADISTIWLNLSPLTLPPLLARLAQLAEFAWNQESKKGDVPSTSSTSPGDAA